MNRGRFKNIKLGKNVYRQLKRRGPPAPPRPVRPEQERASKKKS